MPVARCRAWCRLVVAMLAAGGASCVVPVGPQFQDPLAVQNYAPRIIYTDPLESWPTSNRNFKITVTDPNVGDPLFVRWIADPDSPESIRRLQYNPLPPPVDGASATRTVELMDLPCWQLATNSAEDRLGQHHIRVVVADREFADDDQDPEQVNAPGLTDTADWTLNLSCLGTQ